NLLAVKRSGFSSDIYILNQFGRPLKQLTVNQAPRRSYDTGDNHWAFYPRSSADGKTVFLSYDKPKGGYEVDLSVWSMPVNGGLARGGARQCLSRDDLHVRQADLLPGDRADLRGEHRRAADRHHRPDGRPADLGARRHGHRVPRARDRRPAVPAVVPAQERVLQAGAAAAEPHSGRPGAGDQDEPRCVATASAGGQTNPDVDLASVRRNIDDSLGSLASSPSPLAGRSDRRSGWGRQQPPSASRKRGGRTEGPGGSLPASGEVGPKVRVGTSAVLIAARRNHRLLIRRRSLRGSDVAL